jgi:hypothetical protein
MHINTFDVGTNTGGWAGGANPIVLPDAGQNGAGDGILRITSDSPQGPGSRLAMFNLSSDWIGNYDAAGITAIQGDFMNPLSNSRALDMRLVFFSGSSRWTSTTSLTLPNDGQWHSLTFPISVTELTRTQGTNTYSAMISNVQRAMFRHQTGTPRSQGTIFEGVLNIDNLILLTEPEFFPDANGDGMADVTDFNIWNANRNKTGTDLATGDFNLDGQTDNADLELWNMHRFTANPNAAQPAAVPEPTTLWLSLTALLALRARRRSPAPRELARVERMVTS